MNHKAFAEMIDSTATHHVTIVEDGRLSNAAISLLCRIEHFNDQIENPRTSEKRLAAIDAACAILVDIIDFAESTGCGVRRDDKYILANFVDHKNQIVNLLKKQSWLEIVRMDQERSRKKDQEYVELGRQFEEIFRSRLSLLGDQITDPAQAREWRESWSTVVGEFATRW